MLKNIYIQGRCLISSLPHLKQFSASLLAGGLGTCHPFLRFCPSLGRKHITYCVDQLMGRNAGSFHGAHVKQRCRLDLQHYGEKLPATTTSKLSRALKLPKDGRQTGVWECRETSLDTRSQGREDGIRLDQIMIYQNIYD